MTFKPEDITVGVREAAFAACLGSVSSDSDMDKAIAAALNARSPCVWGLGRYAVWRSGCGERICLDGSPTSNRMKICCFCGAPLQEDQRNG